ncbi:hypothetical protein C8J57DRAFT_1585728 [Mycena rebaudengoi]|nr:hypothetical protein C8J57DRAFT_1585728 [Mycena rebaudengoi]
MNYPIDPNTFASHWDSALARTYGIYAEFLLYGILLVLLCIAGHLLYHWTGAGRKSLALATFAMAILATLQIIIHVYVAVLDFQILRLVIEGAVWPAPSALGPTNLYDRLYLAKDLLLVTNNIVTDGLFIYRCFIVWGRNIRVVVLPMLMLFATTVLGYWVAISPYQLDSRVPIAITILTNMVLMGLTAGRIWWIRRDARIILESVHVHRYNTAIAIMYVHHSHVLNKAYNLSSLESGAIYCLSIFLYVIAISLLSNTSPVIPIFGVAVTQIMNIAPTLMIVRVGLGRTDQDTTDLEEQGQRRAFGFPRARPAAARDTPTFGVRRVTSTVIDITAAHDIDPRADISMTKLGKL